MLDTILQYLRTPLVVLSGTPVTALTIATAVAIMLCARLAAAIVTRSMERVLSARGLDRGLRFAAQKITRYVVMLIGLFVALGTIGVNMSAVMGAGAVLLVGIGFGLQKLAENFISGLLLLLERPVQKGDFIDVGGLLGTVDDIGLRATRVISRDGVTMIVPNANLVTQMVVNHTVPTESRRIQIQVGVAYGTDLDHAVKVLTELAPAVKDVLAEPAPEVRHYGFGDSSINLALLCWIAHARDELIIASALRFAIDRAFRREKIEIPFPQRAIHMLPPAA
ncbi:MAG TPA: mechanosensitive ion channel domain-containing protein [Kofleriaceae bacterium]|nr:mechanosensitive ion channel domain-containing protein [Kofleriaceae bacterium]